jgi:CDGSH-type Zn-finger protein
MKAAVVAQSGPYEVEIVEGRVYLWCGCGRSQRQPYCDSSHAGSGHGPVRFRAEATGTVRLCGCRRTRSRPFCDGTHQTLTLSPSEKRAISSR